LKHDKAADLTLVLQCKRKQAANKGLLSAATAAQNNKQTSHLMSVARNFPSELPTTLGFKLTANFTAAPPAAEPSPLPEPSTTTTAATTDCPTEK
jgi:hypothetical protein